MANIVLTHNCNLKCKYCFASEFKDNSKSEISVENFIYALNFIKKSKNEPIGLIGGEPFLYPHFDEISDILAKDKEIKHVTIFSNGLLLKNHLKHISHKKFSILINCNSKEDIGETQFKNLEENIKLLSTIKNKKSIFFGINIYNKNADYDYIIDLLKQYKQHRLRISVVVPNEHVVSSPAKDAVEGNPLEIFYSYKNTLMRLMLLCLANDIIPYYDCNKIPNCIWTKEEKLYFVKFKKIYEKYKNETKINLLRNSVICNPSLDILPNLQVIRCFGFSNLEKAELKDFKNCEELRNYFQTQIDDYAKLISAASECNNCIKAKISQCVCGCQVYKTSKIIKAKQLIKELNSTLPNNKE